MSEGKCPTLAVARDRMKFRHKYKVIRILSPFVENSRLSTKKNGGKSIMVPRHRLGQKSTEQRLKFSKTVIFSQNGHYPQSSNSQIGCLLK